MPTWWRLQATIWGLCDIDETGMLNAEQFALAMHIISEKVKVRCLFFFAGHTWRYPQQPPPHLIALLPVVHISSCPTYVLIWHNIHFTPHQRAR
jgi:hypothetical protein